MYSAMSAQYLHRPVTQPSGSGLNGTAILVSMLLSGIDVPVRDGRVYCKIKCKWIPDLDGSLSTPPGLLWLIQRNNFAFHWNTSVTPHQNYKYIFRRKYRWSEIRLDPKRAGCEIGNDIILKTLIHRNNKVWQSQSIVESSLRDKTENDIQFKCE